MIDLMLICIRTLLVYFEHVDYRFYTEIEA